MELINYQLMRLENKFEKIKRLYNRKYQPKPVRRVEITNPNKKLDRHFLTLSLDYYLART